MTLLKALTTRIHIFLASERGASMVEYALLAALIAMVAVAALTFVGGQVSSAYQATADGFTNPN
jgi:Flp pilus assembly pilin Flp